MDDHTYTDRELMVVAAGREIRDGEAVFVGMTSVSGCTSPSTTSPRTSGR